MKYNFFQYGRKFKIVLHERYVTQNLQKCLLILIRYLESKSNENWRCHVEKTSLPSVHGRGFSPTVSSLFRLS